MQGTLELSIQVLNLSPTLTLGDINNFFSYCGTVHDVQILSSTTESQGKGGSQSALVTFIQPYAFQTALLLDGAILADQPICVLPAGVSAIPIISDEDEDEDEHHTTTAKKKKQGHVASKGIEMLKKIENELEEKGRVVVEQTISGIGAAEEAAGRLLSGAVEKASKFASHLGTSITNKYKYNNNPNSRKQK